MYPVRIMKAPITFHSTTYPFAFFASDLDFTEKKIEVYHPGPHWYF